MRVPLTLLAVVMLAACKQPPTCVESTAPASAAPVDQGLVAYLSLASALHHEADVAESRKDGNAALTALNRLLDTKTPGTYTEVREVRGDTLARAAQLSLDDGALDSAAAFIERGLLEVPDEGYYRGRLYEVSGYVLQAQSKRLEEAGQLPEAERKKNEAIRDLEHAVRIQQGVIERATPPEKPTP